MALGSIATIAVLAAALIEVPKFRNARAVQGDAKIDAPATISSQQPTAADSTPAAAAADNAPATPAAAEANTPAPSPPRAASIDTRTPAAKNNMTVSPQRPSAQVAVQQTQPVQTVQEPAVPQRIAQQAPVQQPDPVAQAAQATSPPVPVGGSQRARANAAEIRDLQQLYDLLAVRAGTVKSGLASLKQQMARQGLGLRGDIVATEGRMDLQMRRAEDAIRNGDTDEARNSLQLAERAVENIEKFLGR